VFGKVIFVVEAPGLKIKSSESPNGSTGQVYRRGIVSFECFDTGIRVFYSI